VVGAIDVDGDHIAAFGAPKEHWKSASPSPFR
jgi:hypothetical protein